MSPQRRRRGAAPARRTTPARITAALLRGWPLPDPSEGDSKEDRGRVLAIGGSVQVPGAVLLAGLAALRAGAGKLQVGTAAAAALPLAVAMPEAKVLGLPATRAGAIRELGREAAEAARSAGAVLVGPGMDRSAGTRRVAEAALAAARCPVVLDAGALDPAAVRTLRRRARAGGATILTPHAGEMAAMLGADEAEIAADPAGIARTHAQAWGVVLVLKGPTTHIAAPDGRAWVNTAGCAGLGTSGSGDVLAGVIAGLAARGAGAEQAACWGVYLHARAGARLSRRLGLVGFLAREIGDEIPALMRTL
ncbi:NAD(P)H-hydrate dehydratase [Luteimonas sp. Y-2-2-4F]|nr:NAD(P)H-hydrate dehydratase [Luteimonas sp. Y-2-2-4F]MCD9032567.1 NAD(P)H-hydrate dehydratase [Luteimonas sp. Y-2-2-4F]